MCASHISTATMFLKLGDKSFSTYNEDEDIPEMTLYTLRRYLRAIVFGMRTWATRRRSRTSMGITSNANLSHWAGTWEDAVNNVKSKTMSNAIY